MEHKECTYCNNKFPATLEYWHRQEHGKYGLKSVCIKCAKIVRKKYTSTDEFKKYARERQKEYNKKNRERAREINRKSRQKNKDRYNAERREKYKNDPEYRSKKIEYDRKYIESGRRHEMNNKPEQRKKAIERNKKRREDPVKNDHDSKRAAQWRKNNKEHISELTSKRIAELTDSYVASSMRKPVGDLTPETIETKRLIIKIKRELRSNNIKIR